MAGIYGVMAYAVRQRASEIGIRMALDASSGSVLRLMLLQGLVLASIGLALGLTAAVGVTRLLTSMLFQVKPNDPSIYLGVAILVWTVALAACYLPARIRSEEQFLPVRCGTRDDGHRRCRRCTGTRPCSRTDSGVLYALPAARL